MSKNNQEIYIPRSSAVGVLLLHGFTSSPREFLDMAKFLASKNISVYVPAIAGHATTPEDLAKTTIGEWQSSVEDAYVMLKKQVDKVYIIGSSFGGNLAFDLAYKFSDSISGIVSLGTPIKVRRHGFKIFLAYTLGYIKKYQRKLAGDYRVLPPYDKAIYYAHMPVKSIKLFFIFIKKYTIPNLNKITSPALIIQSQSDHTVRPNSAKTIHSNLGSANKKILWINTHNHTLALDKNRGEVYKAVLDFVLS